MLPPRHCARANTSQGGRGGRYPELGRPRRIDRAAAVGRAHGPERDPARVRPESAAGSRRGAGQPRQGFSRRAGDHRGVAEQHCDRADGHRLRRRRAGRSGAGAGGDARRQSRHHPDRAGLVVRHHPGGAAVHPDRGHDVPPRRAHPHPRSGAGRDRPRADAGGARPAVGRSDAVRGCAEPAAAARHDHDGAGDRCDRRRRVHLGGAFERRRRAADHVLCRAGGGAAASRLCPGPRRQSRHRLEPAVRGRLDRRPGGQAAADRQSLEPGGRLRPRAGAARA